MQGKPLLFYASPFNALWDVILQTASGPDPSLDADHTEFFDATLSHRIITYTLFITFIVAMPILFNNFLVSDCNQVID